MMAPRIQPLEAVAMHGYCGHKQMLVRGNLNGVPHGPPLSFKDLKLALFSHSEKWQRILPDIFAFEKREFSIDLCLIPEISAWAAPFGTLNFFPLSPTEKSTSHIKGGEVGHWMHRMHSYTLRLMDRPPLHEWKITSIYCMVLVCVFSDILLLPISSRKEALLNRLIFRTHIERPFTRLQKMRSYILLALLVGTLSSIVQGARIGDFCPVNFPPCEPEGCCPHGWECCNGGCCNTATSYCATTGGKNICCANGQTCQ